MRKEEQMAGTGNGSNLRTVSNNRRVLQRRQIENMLMILCRHEPSFLRARQYLHVDLFPARHTGLAAIWAIVNDYYDEFSFLPNEEQIATEFEARVDTDPEFSDDAIEDTDRFISAIFGPDEETIEGSTKVAFAYLRQYLEDRLMDRVRSDMMNNRVTPNDTFGRLQEYTQEASQIQAVEPNPIRPMFEEGWDENNELEVVKIRTGSSFVDCMLKGGIARTEVVGFLGPHGSLKTTMAVQIGTDIAVNARKEWARNGKEGPLGFCYHFFWEGTLNEMRLRSLSHVGKISRDSLEKGDPASLGRGRRLKDYEKKLFASKLGREGALESEFQRYKTAQVLLNDNYRAIDMTGNDPDNPARGSGLVDEIVSVLLLEKQFYEQQGVEWHVDCVTVDYAGAACKRHCLAHNRDPDRFLRHLLGGFNLELKNKVAVAFDCAVLSLHQLNADANALTVAKTGHGTDAAEARNWRENVDFNIVVGNLDQGQRCLISLDKHRRTPGIAEQIIQLQGEICTVVAADKDWTIDPVQRQIVRRDDMAKVYNGNQDALDDDGYATLPGDVETDVIEAHSQPVRNFDEV